MSQNFINKILKVYCKIRRSSLSNLHKFPRMHQFGDVPDRRLQEQHMAYVEAKTQMEEIENKVSV